MRVITKVGLTLIFCAFACEKCLADDGPLNLPLNSECSIPNHQTKGVCVEREECPEYTDLFNVTTLTTERLSFIINLDCGFDYDKWTSLVCCSSYKCVKKFNLALQIFFKSE